jgi:hypothetical protein
LVSSQDEMKSLCGPILPASRDSRAGSLSHVDGGHVAGDDGGALAGVPLVAGLSPWLGLVVPL